MSGNPSPADSAARRDHRPRRLDLNRHVRQHPLQALELADRTAELFTRLGVVESMCERPRGDAERDGGGSDALAVIGVHQVGESLAEPARRDHHGGLRHHHVLEQDFGLGDAAQAHCAFARADDQAGRLVAGRDEPRDSLFLAALVEHPGEDQMEARDPAAGDPVLAAVDDELAAPPVRARGQLGRRAAGLGLGDADRRLVAAEHPVRPLPLLRRRPVGHDGGDRTHIGLDDDAPGHRADSGEFLDHQRGLQEAETLATERLWHRHPHEAGVAKPVHDVPRVFAGLVDLGRAAGDVVFGKRPRAGLEVDLCRAQHAVQGPLLSFAAASIVNVDVPCCIFARPASC